MTRSRSWRSISTWWSAGRRDSRLSACLATHTGDEGRGDERMAERVRTDWLVDAGLRANRCTIRQAA